MIPHTFIIDQRDKDDSSLNALINKAPQFTFILTGVLYV